MKPEAQRIAIAEACGLDCTYTKEALVRFKDRDGYPDAIFQLAKIPDYLNDLNAMHEVEKGLSPDQKTDYIRLLNKGDFGYRRLAFATSAQRAEAFLRTLGLWKDAACPRSI